MFVCLAFKKQEITFIEYEVGSIFQNTEDIISVTYFLVEPVLVFHLKTNWDKLLIRQFSLAGVAEYDENKSYAEEVIEKL